MEKNQESKIQERREPEKEEQEPEKEKEVDQVSITFIKTGSLLSPEVVMLFWAVILDLAGILFLCLAIDDFGVIDIIGMLTITPWQLFRGSKPTVPEKLKQKGKGVFQKVLNFLFQGKLKRFLTPIAGEVVPYVGGFTWWTLVVWYELTSN